MRRVPEEPVLRTEYLFGTREGGFRYRISLPYQNACFLHRVPLKTCRVPQEAVLRTARIFRTTGGPLRYRMCRMPKIPKIPKMPNAECQKCQGKEVSSSIAPPANSSQMLGKKKPFPRQRYRKSNKPQKEASSPYSTTGKFLAAAIPWQQGNIYSGGGLPRTDLTIFNAFSLIDNNCFIFAKSKQKQLIIKHL